MTDNLIDRLVALTENEIKEIKSAQEFISSEIEKKQKHLADLKQKEAETRELYRQLRLRQNDQPITDDKTVELKGTIVEGQKETVRSKSIVTADEYDTAFRILTQEKDNFSINEVIDFLGINRNTAAMAIKRNPYVIRITPGKTKRNVLYAHSDVLKEEKTEHFKPQTARLKVTTFSNPEDLKNA